MLKMVRTFFLFLLVVSLVVYLFFSTISVHPDMQDAANVISGTSLLATVLSLFSLFWLRKRNGS